MQKDKASGKIDEDFVLVRGADGLPALVSRDSENIFDMVERQEAGDDGTTAADRR